MSRKETLGALFDRIDALINKDGHASKEELTAVFGEHAGDFLSHCDENADAQLTKEEFVDGILHDVEGMSDDDFQAQWANRMDEAVKAAEEIHIPAQPAAAQPAPAPQLPPPYWQMLKKLTAEVPDKELLVFDGPYTESKGKDPARFTVKEIDERSDKLAKNLADQHGLVKGERIVTVCDNRPEMFTLLLACLKSGATCVPLTTDLMTEHEQMLVDLYEPKLVLTSFAGRSFPKKDGEGEWPQLVLPDYYDHQDGEWEKMETEGEPLGMDKMITQADFMSCGIIFSTSGSTGVPKGVMYSNLMIAMHGVAVMLAAKAGTPMLPAGETDSTQLLWVPMRGVVGTGNTLMYTAVGVKSVMIDTPDISPAIWAQVVARHKVTTLCLFGAAMQNFLSDHDGIVNEITAIVYGGSCFPPTLIQQSMKQFPNAGFTQGYSMTECLGMSALGPAFHKHAEECSEADRMIMRSAGKPSPGISNIFIEPIDNPISGERIEDIPDDDAGKLRFEKMGRKRGEGQICAKTVLLMMGYYKNEEKMAETGIKTDGYIRTGDIGRYDENGFLYVIDRLKDIIPTHHGYNVDPRDIEEVLYEHPAVAQAAIVGIPHESGAGEIVVAWVSLHDDKKEGVTRDTLREQCSKLAHHQQPDIFEIMDGPLPTFGGKIGKKILRGASFVRDGCGQRLETLVETALKLNPDFSQPMNEARQYFDRMDFDQSGTIEKEELAMVVGEEHVEAIMNAIDVNRDGVIQADEWVKFMETLPEDQRGPILQVMGSTLAAYEKATHGEVKPFAQ